MTMLNNCDETVDSTDVLENSSNWDALYCSHLWSNSELRRDIINAQRNDNKVIKYCYTCRGKIRKYEIKSPRVHFAPNNHSTPNGKPTKDIESPPCNERLELEGNVINETSNHREDFRTNKTEPVNQYIPTISREIDSSFRQKFTSFEARPNDSNRRLRKSLKGFGCVVNFALTDSPVKKRTQIQACSISVMIVAIVVISFVLVNFTTPSFTHVTNVISTIVVPTKNVVSNETTSAITVESTTLTTEVTLEYITSTEAYTSSTEKSSISNIIQKIRKNIRTYPKNASYEANNIIEDITSKFCSCQNNEICMLDENSGKAVCKEAKDIDDPTGCGGLCAMETEACHLVDRTRGVYVCRLLSLVVCSSSEWRCRNGLCVSAEARCDGAIQCYDRSDEMHCDCDLTKQFRCGHSISCFPNEKLCDRVIDCWDGQDEVNCTVECPEGEFTCTDGQCIPGSRFCDGFPDCGDHSDEPQGCGDCAAHEYRCMNKRCIPKTTRCDSKDDCGDATDEANCS